MQDKQTTSPITSVIVGENLRELREHGDLEYPLGVYEDDMKYLHMQMIRWHWHDELEFIYVKDGSGDFHVSDDCYTLTAGQGILVNQGALHSYQISSGCQNCHYDAIVFHPTLLIAHGQTKLSSVYLQPILTDSNISAMPLTGATPWEQSVLELFQQIIKVNQEKSFCYELYTKQYLLQIWILLLEQKATNQTTPALEAHSLKISMDEVRTKEAIRYIEEHYAEPISLEDIANSIHVSKSECCRCIRRCMKMTPFEYLMKYRIFVAAGILSSGDFDDSMSVLALKVGFNSSSYFNKLFHKYMNCTPTQYKAKQLTTLGSPK
ncbi:MAG: helix-turn-helix transcriptional regulator [Lachnospiraceae bacterium]|nr:helix-turn-helix transcriptional regulator [Lachnospiraceae bacterium]